MRKRIIKLLALNLALLFFAACGAPGQSAAPTAPTFAMTPSETPIAIPTPTFTPAPQLFAPPQAFEPNKFPRDVNPLSAQVVKDPALLKMPALLISISHFPPSARPQAGLSFAPWVFEFSITEGMTRFLGAFYGAFPEPEIPITGGCEIRKGVFIQTGDVIGNRVWLDEDQNGRQESYERGVGGACIHLYRDGQLVDSTTTDSNGYYGFNVAPANYSIGFALPEWLQFTNQNIGDESNDSDANPLDGRINANARGTRLDFDAGLILRAGLIPTPDESARLPNAAVGPIRSGRLLYGDIADFFPNSCLIYAFASPEVLAKIPQCAMVAHDDAEGGRTLPLEQMKAIADENMQKTPGKFNYASNAFSGEVPQGGAPAKQINVYVSIINQSGWTYDPLYGAWLRFVDNADRAAAGQLHAEIDRLTGRQLHFENFMVIFAEHDVISPTNLDIHLEHGSEGFAFLFRDGMKYDIRWSTKSTEYEKSTRTLQPIRFLNPDGSPAALKPGSTWIFVASPYSIISDEGGGTWKLRYIPPEGSR